MRAIVFLLFIALPHGTIYTADAEKKAALAFLETLQNSKEKITSQSLKQAGFQFKTLVAFSTRDKKDLGGHFLNEWWGNDNADTLYNGREDIITVDKEKANNPGNHYVADLIKKFPYIKEFITIETIYFERPETSIINETGIVPVIQYVKTLMPLFSAGKKLVIEWHPFIALCHKPSYVNLAELEYYIKSANSSNPFTGTFYSELCFLATTLSIGKLDQSMIPPHLKKIVAQLIPKINGLLDFYAANQSTTREAIAKCLELEVEILKISEQNNLCSVFIRKSTSIEDFNAHVGDVITSTSPLKKVALKSATYTAQEKSQSQSFTIRDLANYIKFDKISTLFTFLWSDITVIQNGNRAINCVKCLGFKELSLKRIKTPEENFVNGRKNVWWLEATKE